MDFSKIDFNVLDNMDELYYLMDTINKTCNIRVLGHNKHKFQPQGCSIVFLLETSHHSCHTWPELGKINIDFFHCGNRDIVHKTLETVAELYIKHLGGEYKICVLDRYC
jgi:S-adenosylmethionine/arginine decarboxylase-like enzyme